MELLSKDIKQLESSRTERIAPRKYKYFDKEDESFKRTKNTLSNCLNGLGLIKVPSDKGDLLCNCFFKY